MAQIQETYLSPKYYKTIVNAIEERFGKYFYTPRIILKPDLYKTSGALGQTLFLRSDGAEPVLIEIDSDIWHNRPQMGLETLIHELLEWRFIERGEKYPHFMSETHTPEILAAILQPAQLTLIDLFLQRHPMLRWAVLGT